MVEIKGKLTDFDLQVDMDIDIESCECGEALKKSCQSVDAQDLKIV